MKKLVTVIVAIALIIFSQVCAQAQIEINQTGLDSLNTYSASYYLYNELNGEIVGGLDSQDWGFIIDASPGKSIRFITSEDDSGDTTHQTNIQEDGMVQIGATPVPDTLLHVNGATIFQGYLHLHSWNVVGSTDVCRNGATFSYCSSSQRYKENIKPLNMGLETVEKLAPVTFDWKQPGKNDLGLIAEEVEKIDPILVTYNDDGQVEGVKYKQLTAVLVNAIKELKTENEKLRVSMLRQQERMESQQAQLDDQNTRFDELLSKLEMILEGQLVAYNNR